MDKTIYYNNLYDYYGELLTDKQKEYYELYYFENLSLSEIADTMNVSRNAAHNQLKIVIEKLDYYEEKLKLFEKKKKITSLISTLDDKIKNRIEEII